MSLVLEVNNLFPRSEYLERKHAHMPGKVNHYQHIRFQHDRADSGVFFAEELQIDQESIKLGIIIYFKVCSGTLDVSMNMYVARPKS